MRGTIGAGCRIDGINPGFQAGEVIVSGGCLHSGRVCGVLVASGNGADSRCQCGKAPLQCATMEPAHVAGLERVSGEGGKLPKAVWLVQVAIMITGRGWRIAWIEVMAG